MIFLLCLVGVSKYSITRKKQFEEIDGLTSKKKTKDIREF